MKALFTSLVVLAIMVQTFDRFGIILSYEVNKAFIIENFCINKSRPQMKCDGKCHLKVKMDKNEEKKSETPISQEKNEIVLNRGDQHPEIIAPNVNYETLINRDRLTDYTCLHEPLFHPPKVFC